MGDVRAGDEQHEGDGPEQDEQRGADVAHHDVVERSHHDVPVRARILALQPAGDGGHLRPRPLEGGARSQPREDAEALAVAAARALGQGQGSPELGARGPEGRELEPARHHSDHDVRLAVEGDGAAHDAGVPAEAALPQAMAEHDDARVTRLLFFGRERASELRRHAQKREDVRREAHAVDALRPVVAPEVRAPGLGRAHGLEAGRVPPPVEEVPRRHRARAPGEDDGETVRVDIGEWTQQDRVHDAEDRGGRADAQGQGQHGGGREPRRACERPHAVAHVLLHRLQARAHPHRAHVLLDLLHPSHFDEGLTARLLRRQAAGHVLVLEDRGAGTHLVVEVALGPPSVDEVAPEAGQSGGPDHGVLSRGERRRWPPRCGPTPGSRS